MDKTQAGKKGKSPAGRQDNRQERTQGRPPSRSQGRPPAGKQAERPARSQGRPPAGRDAERQERTQGRPPSRSQGRPPAGKQAERPARSQGRPPAGRDAERPERTQGRPPARTQGRPSAGKQVMKRSLSTGKKNTRPLPGKDSTEPVRLNRYIANCGICARREADELIKKGHISVNGVRVTDMGIRVRLTDTVEYNGRKLKPEKKIYILLNKPKGYVTTVKDPHAEATVIDLVRDAAGERIYPVGRLDKSTTGVLLLTNDGELAGKLTHPRFGARKIYLVGTDRDVTRHDMEMIVSGVELDDGTVSADAISYADPEDRTQVGLEIHSGQNRVVRRIFEKLGYRVKKLDRVSFAGLTKKNLPRGTWRHLTSKELSMLKRGIFK